MAIAVSTHPDLAWLHIVQVDADTNPAVVAQLASTINERVTDLAALIVETGDRVDPNVLQPLRSLDTRVVVVNTDPGWSAPDGMVQVRRRSDAVAFLRKANTPITDADTIVELLRQLGGQGWDIGFHIRGPSSVTCGGCGHTSRPATLSPAHTYRFDHDTGPGQQSLVIELVCPQCVRCGTLVAAYGPAASPDEAAAIAAMAPAPKDTCETAG